MFSSKTPLDKLQEKSGKILDVFTSTVVDLHAVNQEIDAHLDDHAAQIATLQANHAKLTSIKGGNLKVIDRINTIIA